MSEQRHKSVPLTPAKLEELALAYVARFATTQGKLRAYLQRKLRERGWRDEGDRAFTEEDDTGDMRYVPASALDKVEAVVERFGAAGYVDDAAWARMKSGALARRGYGARRVEQALHHAGIDADVRDDLAPAARDAALAAIALVRRRRFGPFAREHVDPARHRKQLAAMLRAGHEMTIARTVLDLADEPAVQAWLDSFVPDDDAAA